ncbi:MAG: hypothetical protein HY302_10570 [Opitutae bacterium]|nr:hypothetical protein [Opitutae bacterium]
MKKILALLSFAMLALAARAALQVDVVTIKAQPNSATLLVEYQVRDDKDTPTPADDTIGRHGDTVEVPYTAETTAAQIRAAARADAEAKNLVPSP